MASAVKINSVWAKINSVFLKISSVFNKPIHISEFGAGAKYGNHSDKIWSEEYQARLYRHQLEMLSNNPQIKGISPLLINIDLSKNNVSLFVR